MNGKIIVNIAISLDGYIAKEDGSFDWIVGSDDARLDTVQKNDFSSFIDQMDYIVMGGDCYRQKMHEQFPAKKIYVITKQTYKDEAIDFISPDAIQSIVELKQKGKNIYLFGGGQSIDPFLKLDCIDEYIIGIIPTILGSGKRLFLENNPTILLNPTSYTIENGVVALHYIKRK